MTDYYEEDRLTALRRQREKDYDRSTPRLVERQPPSRWGPSPPRYRLIRLGSLVYLPKYPGGPAVTVSRGSFSARVADVGERWRRPTAKALRRVEEAEARLRQAQAELDLATRAAFTYGRHVTLAAVKANTKARKRASEAE